MTDTAPAIHIRNLDGIPFSEITEAFLSAFADYAITLSPRSLADMLKRRGARFDLSFAAFANDRIVSFIINGIGAYNGQTTAYDTGTGTIKQYRGLGLTDRIFTASLPALVNAGVQSYLLEVLTTNQPAIKIYTHQGFTAARTFDCFTARTSQSLALLRRPTLSGLRIEAAPAEAISNLTGFMDFNPSWQNSMASILRNPEAFLCLIAYRGLTPVGFGVSETAYGDITLLAVEPHLRRQGIGSALLRRLLKQNQSPTAKALNIDTRCTTLPLFLQSSGFTPSCSQYEMTRPLP